MYSQNVFIQFVFDTVYTIGPLCIRALFLCNLYHVCMYLVVSIMDNFVAFSFIHLYTTTVAFRKTGLFGKLLCKWGHFESAKTTLKMLGASWFLVNFLKRFRSFNAKNLRSKGQRASKLLAVKVGGLKKMLKSVEVRLAQIWLRRGSNISQSLTNRNFATL